MLKEIAILFVVNSEELQKNRMIDTLLVIKIATPKNL